MKSLLETYEVNLKSISKGLLYRLEFESLDKSSNISKEEGSVFLSYSGSNSQTVEQFQVELSKQNIQFSNKVSESVFKNLEDSANRIVSSQIILICNSQNYCNDLFAMEEFSIASKLNKRILAVSLDGHQPTGLIGKKLAIYQNFDISTVSKFQRNFIKLSKMILEIKEELRYFLYFLMSINFLKEYLLMMKILHNDIVYSFRFVIQIRFEDVYKNISRGTSFSSSSRVSFNIFYFFHNFHTLSAHRNNRFVLGD